MSDYQKSHHLKKLPSLLEFFGYVFCFGNLLAGPIIEFKDYQVGPVCGGVAGLLRVLLPLPLLQLLPLACTSMSVVAWPFRPHTLLGFQLSRDSR
jgi:hypothetical protein